MSLLPVRLYTDKILHQSCEPVINFVGLDALAQDMIETMFAYKGVGLAAPQIGLGSQLAVLNIENKSKLIALANIKIICYNKEMDLQQEGCLSCPGVSVPVKRYLGVEIEAQNLLGEKVNYKFDGYDARILQHEYDHLQGRLITQGLIKI
jgi:peptide deformylase